MTPSRSAIDTIGFVLITVCVGVSQWSIAAAQILFGVAAILWLVSWGRERRPLALPKFYLPLVVYAGLTLISAALSLDPRASFWDSRQLLLWLMVPTVVWFVRGSGARQVMDVVIALGACGALYGIVQVTMLGGGGLGDKRVDGPLTHYMTYSGVLMMVTCAAVSRLMFDRREWVWPAVAVPALLTALAFTEARNAWVGTFVAVVCLLALKNWKLIVLAPIVAGLGYAVAPPNIKARANSMFDMNDPTNRDRRAMIEVGAGMIRDNPVWGVGPEMVLREYPKYKPSWGVNEVNPHLHNVPLQIAAERGLPALAAWLWFVVVALREHFREFKRGRHPAVAATGLAAMIAMLTAGLLEYNFGDSEFLMLFLALITLPAAAAQHDAPALAAPQPVARVRRGA
jgi:O-antigen ligase